MGLKKRKPVFPPQNRGGGSDAKKRILSGAFQVARHGPWQPDIPLFPEPSRDCAKILALLQEVLREVWPLSANHRKDLPEHIAELSGLLTRERSALRHSYWSRPAFVSAYLYYFLPWNIIRLARLFSGLPLETPDSSTGRIPIILDVGSGPLALPIALWTSKPQWRNIPLRIFALDISSQPMELGRKILACLAEKTGTPVWQSFSVSGPAEQLASRFHAFRAQHAEMHAYPWLISAANVLNEIQIRNPDRKSRILDEDADMDHTPISMRMLESWSPLWTGRQSRPQILFVEPGTRYGGTAIMRLRKQAMEAGFAPLAPCVADNACPLLVPAKKGHSQPASWCHFTFSATGAPEWLSKISREAGLDKTALSLAPLLLGTPGSEHRLDSGDIRVISQPFHVPGLQGQARYGCCRRGLVLLEDAAKPASGALVRGKITSETDAKSGAMIAKPA